MVKRMVKEIEIVKEKKKMRKKIKKEEKRMIVIIVEIEVIGEVGNKIGKKGKM